MEGNMVTKEYIARAAMEAYRKKGTAIARAALKALGIKAPPMSAPPEGTTVSYESYTEIRECFANNGSPLSGLIKAPSYGVRL